MCIHLSIIFAEEKISIEDATYLSPFFKLLLENTESGYVFYDKKPICIQAFSPNNILLENEFHKFSASVWGASKILTRPIFHSKNICFRINHKDEYILSVNRFLFLKVVRENLALFQYVLGPSVTPESLLELLLAENSSFNAVFNDDQVLIGIVLGYGVQHSLFVGRLEKIMESAFARDVPPLSSKVALCDDSWKEMLLFTSEDENIVNNKFLKPGFGFSSLSEEQEGLMKKIDLPSEQLTNQKPSFIFGCVNNLEENKQRIDELEETQKDIIKLMQSPTFLQDILEVIAEEKVVIENLSYECLQFSNVNPNITLAKLIKSLIRDINKQDVSFFLEGLLSNERINDDLQTHRMASFPGFSKNVALARENIIEADQFFSKLEEKSDFVSVLDSYLYYQILQQTEGRSLKTETSVRVDFEIYDPHGKCLHCGSNEILDLHETIPGFAHGIKGMKMGEKREIFIHPALAYGVHTYLEKGIYLKIVVKLVEVHDSIGKLNPLVPLDLAFIRNNDFLTKCEEEQRNAFHLLGKKIRRFLKSCKAFDVVSVSKSLRQTEDKILSAEEAEALNQIFWNHYFANS
ncbi:MAG: hypothetical protein K940chlam9_01100 [Chlamydiae bacterium]|nr:hypothetical protein [Chlamydiota bacterium]